MRKTLLCSLTVFLNLAIVLPDFCFALDAKMQSEEIKNLDTFKLDRRNGASQDTIFQESNLDITISHPLQNHFSYNNNVLTITQESKELAATFNDPARVLYRHPSVSTGNDQANGIVFRGLPSQLTKWTIYGAEIVNPNHLSNAGTLSDQGSASAGGVLAIPFDVVKEFSFHANPLELGQVNSISGNLDFEFGLESEDFVKTGLLGIEGSYQSKGKSKFKVHGRYSTVGLLSDLGVDFGGEAINFQDLFLEFKISDHLSFFSVLGSSNNNKSFLDNQDNIEDIKDIQAINFESLLSIQGLHYNKGSSAHTLVFSHSKYDWQSEVGFNIPEFFYLNAKTSQEDTKISYKGIQSIGRNIDSGLFHITLNASWVHGNSSVFSRQFEGSNLRIDPSVEWKKLFGRFIVQAGLATPFDSYRAAVSVEPQASIRWHHRQISVTINSSLSYHRQDNLIIKDRLDNPVEDGEYLDPSRSWSNSLGWKWNNDRRNQFFLARLFLHKMHNLPVRGRYSPMVNSVDLFTEDLLKNSGSATTYGIELMYDISLKGGLYINVNGSFFDAEYTAEDGTSLDTENNFGEVLNIVLSKEITNRKSNKWLINVAGHFRGGAYEKDIFNAIIPDKRLSSYWRIDARFQYAWKTNNILSLDIQNVLNYQNEAYHYFDPWTETIKLKRQLGMIPVLSYTRKL